MSKIVLESLSEFVNNTSNLFEAFQSDNLTEFNNWVRQNAGKNGGNTYLNGGLFYNHHHSLKPHQLTNENSFLFYDYMDAANCIKKLLSQDKEVGVLVANKVFGAQPYLGGEYLPQIENFRDYDLFLVFFKSDDVDMVTRRKPSSVKNYQWGGPKSMMIGNHRAAEFSDRKQYNDYSAEHRKEMDDYVKNNNYAGWNNVKD